MNNTIDESVRRLIFGKEPKKLKFTVPEGSTDEIATVLNPMVPMRQFLIKFEPAAQTANATCYAVCKNDSYEFSPFDNIGTENSPYYAFYDGFSFTYWASNGDVVAKEFVEIPEPILGISITPNSEFTDLGDGSIRIYYY